MCPAGRNTRVDTLTNENCVFLCVTERLVSWDRHNRGLLNTEHAYVFELGWTQVVSVLCFAFFLTCDCSSCDVFHCRREQVALRKLFLHNAFWSVWFALSGTIRLRQRSGQWATCVFLRCTAWCTVGTSRGPPRIRMKVFCSPELRFFPHLRRSAQELLKDSVDDARQGFFMAQPKCLHLDRLFLHDASNSPNREWNQRSVTLAIRPSQSFEYRES